MPVDWGSYVIVEKGQTLADAFWRHPHARAITASLYLPDLV